MTTVDGRVQGSLVIGGEVPVIRVRLVACGYPTNLATTFTVYSLRASHDNPFVLAHVVVLAYQVILDVRGCGVLPPRPRTMRPDRESNPGTVTRAFSSAYLDRGMKTTAQEYRPTP